MLTHRRPGEGRWRERKRQVWGRHRGEKEGGGDPAARARISFTYSTAMGNKFLITLPGDGEGTKCAHPPPEKVGILKPTLRYQSVPMALSAVFAIEGASRCICQQLLLSNDRAADR